MAAHPKHFYEFGPFRIDVSERTLSRNGQIIGITPKAFEVLLVLVQNRGETVDKEILLNRVWPDSFVEEGILAVNITALSRVLGESPDERRYIETVPSRGYRFVGAVTERQVNNRRPGTGNRWRMMKASVGAALAVLVVGGLFWYFTRKTTQSSHDPARIRSIAVLPFLPLTKESQDEYFQFG